VADNIDGKRISDSHLRQLALVMKILNGANRRGQRTYGWVVFLKMAVIIRMIEAKVAAPQIITMRINCERRVISFSISWITRRRFPPIFSAHSLSGRLFISIHVFISRKKYKKKRRHEVQE
jgi:hypothetical protein